jgi:hypothetical protein
MPRSGTAASSRALVVYQELPARLATPAKGRKEKLT